MTTTEKIANAQKRIDELERLIKYWNNSDHDEAKMVNFDAEYIIYAAIIKLKYQ